MRNEDYRDEEIKFLASEATYFISMLKRGVGDLVRADATAAAMEEAKLRHCYILEELEALIEEIKLRMDADTVIH
jgi:hypothetical protein